MPLQSNYPNFPNTPSSCCTSLMLPPAFLLCMVTTGAHPSLTASLPGTSSTLLQSSFKKTKSSPFPLEEGCSSLPQSVWSQSSPTPVPGPSKCFLHLLQLLGVTQSLEQLLLLSNAFERNNLRLKESKISNETLSLSCKSLFGSSVTCGAVGKNAFCIPG